MMKRIAFASFGLLVLLTALVATWLFLPRQVLKRVDPKIRIITPSVQPGSSLIYELAFCKDTAQQATIRRELVDTIVITFPITSSNTPVGCGPHRFFQRIPAGVPPGKYKFTLTATYRVNPLRDQDYQFESEPFEVKEVPCDGCAATGK